ncbi:hypothetical protein HWV62_29250 [Athelia sp. TMB]|nr:hypothetical protein HWV62_29250 [Athelia sp. TMB]
MDGRLPRIHRNSRYANRRYGHRYGEISCGIRMVDYHQTGLLTSIGALIMLVFSLALPNTALWLGASGFYCKLYSNSLMASLNAREILRNMATEDDRIANMG